MTNKRNDSALSTNSVRTRQQARESRNKKIDDARRKEQRNKRSKSRTRTPTRTSRSKESRRETSVRPRRVNEKLAPDTTKSSRSVVKRIVTKSNISAVSDNSSKTQQNEIRARRQFVKNEILKKENIIPKVVPQKKLKNEEPKPEEKVRKDNSKKKEHSVPNIAEPVGNFNVLTRPKWRRASHKTENEEVPKASSEGSASRAKWIFHKNKEEDTKPDIEPKPKYGNRLTKIFRQEEEKINTGETKSKEKPTHNIEPDVTPSKKFKLKKPQLHFSKRDDSLSGSTNLLDQLVLNFNVDVDDTNVLKKLFKRQVWAVSKMAIKSNKSWRQPFINNGINIDDIDINRIDMNGIDVHKLGSRHKRLKQSLIWLLK